MGWTGKVGRMAEADDEYGGGILGRAYLALVQTRCHVLVSFPYHAYGVFYGHSVHPTVSPRDQKASCRSTKTSANVAPQAHQDKLLAAHLKLTFRYQSGNAVDEERRKAFRDLVLHHLYQYVISAYDDWTDKGIGGCRRRLRLRVGLGRRCGNLLGCCLVKRDKGMKGTS